jgi:hypothetical protein
LPEQFEQLTDVPLIDAHAGISDGQLQAFPNLIILALNLIFEVFISL